MDAMIGRALHGARNLLDLIESNTPRCYAVRMMLDGEGFDVAGLRAEVEVALSLPVAPRADTGGQHANL